MAARELRIRICFWQRAARASRPPRSTLTCVHFARLPPPLPKNGSFLGHKWAWTNHPHPFQDASHFDGRWEAVECPRGCLILWLSRTPHGNKLADRNVDPQRRVVYISDRRLVSDERRPVLKQLKLDAVYRGGSTDHWSIQIPKVHAGSHYSLHRPPSVARGCGKDHTKYFRSSKGSKRMCK